MAIRLVLPLKDTTHKRRTEGCAGTVVKFTEQVVLTLEKEQFLANKENKQSFIKMLGQKLHSSCCNVFHAEGDADLLIVQTAIELFIGNIRHRGYWRRYRITGSFMEEM